MANARFIAGSRDDADARTRGDSARPLRTAFKDEELMRVVITTNHHRFPAGGDYGALHRGFVTLLRNSGGGPKENCK
jgi:hypothetical protein